MQNGLKQQFYSISRSLLQTETEIITGGNNSATIANITLNFIMITVPQIFKMMTLSLLQKTISKKD